QSSRVRLEYSSQALTVRLEVQAAIDAAVPLPGVAKQWLPTQISIDGRAAEGLSRDDTGTLWAFVRKGNHQVLLSGRLPDRDTVQLPLPLPAHNVSAGGNGWSVEGIHKDGQAEGTLELRRQRGRGGAPSRGGALEATQLPPFVVVERDLVLGL